MIGNNQNHFLEILKNIPENSNPFISFHQSDLIDNIWNVVPEEYIPKKEVRCPICLGRVMFAVRPNSCLHVFCKSCLRKWAETKNACPYCRRNFSTMIKLNLTEDFIQSQGEYFAKYY